MTSEKDFPAVFGPVNIGRAHLKNRLVFPAMCTFHSDDQGSITPRVAEFVRARARGGVGTFIIPATPYGEPSIGRPAISDDRYIPGWRGLKAIAAEHGMGLFAQLHPSRLHPGDKKNKAPDLYTIEDIQALVRIYAEGAARAKAAGLDGVEIAGAHAHEITMFLSPLYNKRTDEYGGDLKGRSKFALAILRAIKDKAGAHFPVIFRFSVEERVAGGRELDESLLLARMLQEGGADALHASVSAPGSPQFQTVPADVPPGFITYLAAAVKKVVSIPVITVGRINDLALAEKIIRDGQADLVAMGRALLADPDLPAKSAAGKRDEIIRCIACNQACDDTSDKGVGCVQNPCTGREYNLFFNKVSGRDVKNVLVAGAGPAGLEAACVLAERGHKVKIFEQAAEPGGTFLLACKAPFKDGFMEVIRNRTGRLKRLGVEITFGKKVDVDLAKQVAPDLVVVATGSSAARPSFPLHGAEYYTPDQALTNKPPAGNKVLVIGGGAAGCDVTDYLSARGYKVDLVHRPDKLAADLNVAHRYYLLERFKKNGVNIMLSTEVVDVNLPRAKLLVKGFERASGDYDSVVVAIRRSPNKVLAEALGKMKAAPKVVVIGDALSSRTAEEAIAEAATAAAAV